MKLPNVQDVPFDTAIAAQVASDNGLVADCSLDDMEYEESIL
jgi:hypothetical protein